MEFAYTATKTRSGRPGWSVMFRHPLRHDPRGKPGLRIRRGLNTTDDQQADELVAQVNTLLADRRWWSADRRGEAEREFAPQVVAAFFDGIGVGRPNTFQVRQDVIRLPAREDGYSRVLFVGTTGAGKTTLLRHLIGSSHEHDRFPSTSTARTTIADIEIVTADGPYDAAITFMSEFEVRAHIDECIEAACLEVIQGQADEKIADALLTHREQRFRLSYILGDWRFDDTAEPDDFNFDAISAPASVELNNEERVSEDERKANAERLVAYIERVRALAVEIAARTTEDFGPLEGQATPDDKAVWLEFYGDQLFESEEFAKLALDIKDDVESRFDRLPDGILQRSSTGWPLLWSFSSEDRGIFLQEVRWFSSNHFRQFGRLLTPLVDGVRVRGPFRPAYQSGATIPHLVLLDGQGLGHTAESASSISTRVTQRFADVDVILLVDSAQQPMQAAPLALLRAVGSAGYADKIAVAFTHFDQVKGDNLQRLAQKQTHVIASITNAIVGLRQILGVPVATALERRLNDRVFLFGGLDRETGAIPPGVIGEMAKMLTFAEAAAAPSKPIEARPCYTTGGLELALRDAVDGFLRPWEARLGLAYRDGIRAEHWTRVKALSRRYANGWAWPDEYDSLRPASDLIGRLQEQISRWLDSPASWTRQPNDDDERTAALNPVRNAVFTALHDLTKIRLDEQHREDWLTAYTRFGRGSGRVRATDVRRIFEESAPPISSAMSPSARTFLADVVGIVRDAVEKSGGQFDLPRAA